MSKIIIEGGAALTGEIEISGAKNAALPLMCACLLSTAPLTLTHVPNLRDIRSLVELLESLGVQISSEKGRIAMDAGTLTSTTAAYDLVRKMRASVLVLGPLVARNGEASVSLPGGCAIGTRPVDLHLMGLEALGAEIRLEGGYIHAIAKDGLKGANITFPKVSVGAT
ncbi:MAG: UDP-N-acetylglucosamine 1-carboxyvinyltransferase, partial [Pseudomonadota bacterium]